MTCDHSATRASLAAFCAQTVRHYVDSDGESGVALFGACKFCASTIGIPIVEARASVVASGTIDSRDVVGPCGHYGCSGENCDNEPPF